MKNAPALYARAYISIKSIARCALLLARLACARALLFLRCARALRRAHSAGVKKAKISFIS